MEKPINITLDGVNGMSGKEIYSDKYVVCDFSVKMMLTEKQVMSINRFKTITPEQLIELINDRKAL